MINRLSFVIACFIVLCFIGTAVTRASNTEVVVWMWTAHVTEQHQTWQRKIKTWFEEENPGTTLTFEFTDTASGEKLTAAVASGVPPDVSLVSIAHARTFYENGMFMELNDFISKTPEMAPEQFLPSAVLFGQKDGRVFGLPWSLEARAVQYNRDHFLEAGLDDRPESIATWDDMAHSARTVTRRDPAGQITRSGMVLGRGVSNFAAYLYANGGNFYNAAGTAVAFNDSRGIEALEMMRRFSHELDVTRSGAAWADIANGMAAMVIGDTSATSRIKAVSPDFTSWLHMAPIPRGPQGERSSSVSWSNMFVIPTGAKNPELAWNFIKLWLSEDVVVERFKHIGGESVTSPRRDFFESDVFFDAMREVPYMSVMSEIFTNAGPYPYIRFNDINREMGPLLTQADINGTLAPAAALTEAERLANAILNP